jgi:hypothetical protein
MNLYPSVADNVGWMLAMTRDELIVQLIKIALAVAIGVYFIWWSLEVLHRLPLH